MASDVISPPVLHWDGYQCGKCGREFKTEQELIQHQYSSHPSLSPVCRGRWGEHLQHLHQQSSPDSKHFNRNISRTGKHRTWKASKQEKWKHDNKQNFPVMSRDFNCNIGFNQLIASQEKIRRNSHPGDTKQSVIKSLFPSWFSTYWL